MLFCQARLSAQGAPATQPAFSIGDVQVQDLKGYSYAFISSQANLEHLIEIINTLIPQLNGAIDAGTLHARGPGVFTYHGASMDRQKWFTLDIGIMVVDGSQAPAGFGVRQVPNLHCATVLYTGSTEHLPAAYEKLFSEVGKRGLEPTDVTREVYLYWEGRESPNNVIQLQVDLAPGGPGKM
jgi:effector-binding domain-containing protein